MATDIRQMHELQVIHCGDELRRTVNDLRAEGNTVGLVPTMGALHAGHLSLVDAARAACDATVATIFVNPTQFGAGEDLDAYPTDLDADLAALEERKCDLVFVPSVDQMYPLGHTTTVDVGELGRVLEGVHRPTHFQGVATVVLKLLNLAPADRAYFGRKDYQQTLVVKKLVDDLNLPIDIRVCPTVREPDGLAMSSRNRYLNADQRQRALALYQSLQLAQQLVDAGERDVAALREAMEKRLADADVQPQYIEFVANGTCDVVEKVAGPTVVVLAAQVGPARLIDNLLIHA